MRRMMLFTITLSIFALTGCETDDNNYIDITNENMLYSELSSDIKYGSIGALQDEELTLEAMLIYAIQDEYSARAEYEYILANFDITKPFTNIMRSEESHIAMLIPLFQENGIPLPEDTSSEHIILIEDLASTFSTGILAEEYNISMYNKFLEQENLPESMRDVFVKLRDASINHLNAFIKNAAKY